MSSRWPMVKLNQFMSLRRADLEVVPDVEYQFAGVYCFGRGAFVGKRRLGAEFAYRQLTRLHSGDFVYPKLMAWEGAFAVVPTECHGLCVSPEFPVFEIDRQLADPPYLDLYFRRAAIWPEVSGGSTGTNVRRRRLHPSRFLEYALPLPPLSEQRRLVERIDALAAKIEGAKRLRDGAFSASSSLVQAERRRLFSIAGETAVATLEEVCESIIDTLHSDPIYSPEGVPCVRSPDIKGGRLNLQHTLKTSEEEYQRRTIRGQPSSWDIVYCRQGGGTGRAAVVQPGDRFSLGQAMMLLRPKQNVIHPDYLAHQLQSPAVIEDQLRPCYIGTASPRVNIGALRKFRLLVPTLDQQQRTVDYLAALERSAEEIQQAQRNVGEALDAMLPAILDRAFRRELL